MKVNMKQALLTKVKHVVQIKAVLVIRIKVKPVVWIKVKPVFLFWSETICFGKVGVGYCCYLFGSTGIVNFICYNFCVFILILNFN